MIGVGDAGEVPRHRQVRVERQRAFVQRQRLAQPVMQEGADMAGDGQRLGVLRVQHDGALGRRPGAPPCRPRLISAQPWPTRNMCQ